MLFHTRVLFYIFFFANKMLLINFTIIKRKIFKSFVIKYMLYRYIYVYYRFFSCYLYIKCLYKQ